MNGTNGHSSVLDGSWELRILVTDLQVERTIRVKSELHVGGVMIKLVDELGKEKINHLSQTLFIRYVRKFKCIVKVIEIYHF